MKLLCLKPEYQDTIIASHLIEFLEAEFIHAAYRVDVCGNRSET